MPIVFAFIAFCVAGPSSSLWAPENGAFLGTNRIKPLASGIYYRQIDLDESQSIVLKGNQIESRRLTEPESKWIVRPSDQPPVILRWDKDELFVVGGKRSGWQKEIPVEPLQQVWRVDRKSGNKRTLPVPDKAEAIFDLMVDSSRLVMLTKVFRNITSPDRKVCGFRLHAFTKGALKPFWSIDLPYRGQYADNSLSAGSIDDETRVQGGLRSLSFAGSATIVCLSNQDLVAVETATGKLLWQIKRHEQPDGVVYWQREEWRDKEWESSGRVSQSRIRFDGSNWDSGPFVVRVGQKQSQSWRILVGMRRPIGPLTGGYPEDAHTIYELADTGYPVGSINLPQWSGNRIFQASDRRLLIAGPWRYLMSLTWWLNNPASGFVGPTRAEIEWFKAFIPVEKNGWLVAHEDIPAVGFSSTHSFRAPVGFMEEKAGTNYQIPIDVVSHDDGSVKKLRLTLPLSKLLDPPRTNYSAGPSGYRVHGFMGLYIQSIEVHGNRLRFGIGTYATSWEKPDYYIDFDLRSAMAQVTDKD